MYEEIEIVMSVFVGALCFFVGMTLGKYFRIDKK